MDRDRTLALGHDDRPEALTAHEGTKRQPDLLLRHPETRGAITIDHDVHETKPEPARLSGAVAPVSPPPPVEPPPVRLAGRARSPEPSKSFGE